MRYSALWRQVCLPTSFYSLAKRTHDRVRVRVRLFGRYTGRIFAPLERHLRARIAELGPRQQRLLAGGGTILAQGGLVLVLIIGGRVAVKELPAETIVTISGTPGTEQLPAKAMEIAPELPALAPPEIQISDAVDSSIQATPGLANVSAPAQAIAAAHIFPAIPAAYKAKAPLSVRLIISVSEAGTVDTATIDASCGIAQVDGFAIDWVKSHWRYRPALRGGVPVAVQTTAVVTFQSA